MTTALEELLGDQSDPKKAKISKNRYIARFFDEESEKTVFEQFFPTNKTELIRAKNSSSGFDRYFIKFEGDGKHYINLTEEFVDDFTNEIIKSSIEVSLPRMKELNLSKHKVEDVEKYREFVFNKMKEISELSIDNLDLWLKPGELDVDCIDISHFLRKEKREITLLCIRVISRICEGEEKFSETLRKNIRETGSVFTAFSKCPSYYFGEGRIPSEMKKGKTITKFVSYHNGGGCDVDMNHNWSHSLNQYFIMYKIFNCLPVEGVEYQLLVSTTQDVETKDPNFNWVDNIYNKIWGNVGWAAGGLNFCGFIKKFTDTKNSSFYNYEYTEPNNLLSDGRIESHVAQLFNDISDD